MTLGPVITPISYIADELRIAFPLAEIQVDPPTSDGTSHHLEVCLNGKLVVVEWQALRGLGVSLIQDPALDEGPDRVYSDPTEAVEYAMQLLP